MSVGGNGLFVWNSGGVDTLGLAESEEGRAVGSGVGVNRGGVAPVSVGEKGEEEEGAAVSVGAGANGSLLLRPVSVEKNEVSVVAGSACVKVNPEFASNPALAPSPSPPTGLPNTPHETNCLHVVATS